MNNKPVNKLPLKYRWSHRLWIHRVLVKCYNFIASILPFSIKYGVGKKLKKNTYPYNLIQSGEVKNIMQIGAPTDTLKAGRSRGMYFGLFNKSGKTIIVEPASSSEKEFNKIINSQKIENMQFYRSGAWNEKKLLKLYIDPSHPATNFTEGTVKYSEDRLKDFDLIEIPCDSVDNILTDLGIDSLDLVSMTTNGAEIEIIEGMEKTLHKGIKYICIARHLHIGDYEGKLESLGYKLLAYDDRGYTFKKHDNIREVTTSEG